MEQDLFLEDSGKDGEEKQTIYCETSERDLPERYPPLGCNSWPYGLLVGILAW